jgi:Ca2+:H+ antiporter
VASFNAEGSATALATVTTLATLCLVLPTFTTSRPGPEFSPAQLAFAAVAALALYGLFVVVQTVRHRDYFLPVGVDADADGHADPPSGRQALASLGLLLVALVAVVGLANIESPAIENAVAAAGAPPSAVGVVIALLVLAPETLAAVRNARRDRVQTSFNLAFGSAMASIGLTIPVIAVASIWLEGPLVLGLGATQMVLLAITVVVGALTVLPGRATLQEGGVHLAVFAAFRSSPSTPDRRGRGRRVDLGQGGGLALEEAVAALAGQDQADQPGHLGMVLGARRATSKARRSGPRPPRATRPGGGPR